MSKIKPLQNHLSISFFALGLVCLNKYWFHLAFINSLTRVGLNHLMRFPNVSIDVADVHIEFTLTYSRCQLRVTYTNSFIFNYKFNAAFLCLNLPQVMLVLIGHCCQTHVLAYWALQNDPNAR